MPRLRSNTNKVVVAKNENGELEEYLVVFELDSGLVSKNLTAKKPNYSCLQCVAIQKRTKSGECSMMVRRPKVTVNDLN